MALPISINEPVTGLFVLGLCVVGIELVALTVAGVVSWLIDLIFD